MDKLTDIQEQILNGHLLGDGSIGKQYKNGNAKFIIKRKTEDKQYLLWSAKHFENYLYETGLSDYENFDKRTNKTYYASTMVTRSLPVFTKYYDKWYPEDKKIVPKDLILTPLTIAVWFADDGTFNNNTKNRVDMNFSTEGFCYQDVEFLTNQLQCMYGDKVHLTPKGKNYIIRITTTATANLLLNEIYSLLPPMNKMSKISQHSSINIQLKDNNFIIEPINFYTKPSPM